MLVGATLVLIAELLKDTVGRSQPMGFAAFGLFAIGMALKVRDLSKDFRVWRLLRPEYRGLDDFARRINASPEFLASFITRAPGEASVDAIGLIGEMSDLLPRIDFVGNDPARNAVAAQINAEAFRGSVFHAIAAAKLARNQPIATRQPASFALIRADAHAFSPVGLAAVLPLNAAGVTAYLAGKLSDNDLATRHIPKFGERPQALLVLLIASANIGPSRAGDQRGVLDVLVQLCLLQIVILAAQGDCADEIQIIVANATPKWADTFRRMQFVECPEYGSADQQTVFECRLSIRQADAALDRVVRAVPRFAQQLAPATNPVSRLFHGPDD